MGAEARRQEGPSNCWRCRAVPGHMLPSTGNRKWYQQLLVQKLNRCGKSDAAKCLPDSAAAGKGRAGGPARSCVCAGLQSKEPVHLRLPLGPAPLNPARIPGKSPTAPQDELPLLDFQGL